MMDPEELNQARKKAMKLLEHMDRTEKGLSDRLRQAGFSEEAAAGAMEYVQSYGYIDDARYARTYISYRMNTKSRQKIMQELAQKGIDSHTAREAWEEMSELFGHDEQGVLRSTIEKKCTPGTVLDEREMRRLYGYLARRGFQPGDISRMLDEMEITLCHNRD